MRTLVVSAFVIATAACSQSPAPQKTKYRVLTYSSMNQAGGLGEEIKKLYSERCKLRTDITACELVLMPEEGDSSLVATYLKSPNNYDAILGLETMQLAQLATRSAIVKSEIFARSPHAFIVDTEQWPDPKAWPKNWKSLAEKKDIVLIQDPRMSSVGIGWLKAIFVHQLVDLKSARSLSKKIFPSWSLSYAAFQKGGAPLVWSYQSSEAYHICEEKSERFKVLPLEEGYPVQEEHVAVPGKILGAEAQLLFEVVLSPEIQQLIPLKHWMWPALAQTPLPECYQRVTPVKALKHDNPRRDASSMQKWTDQWSL